MDDGRCNAMTRDRYWGNRCKRKATKHGLCTQHFNSGCSVPIWKNVSADGKWWGAGPPYFRWYCQRTGTSEQHERELLNLCLQVGIEYTPVAELMVVC